MPGLDEAGADQVRDRDCVVDRRSLPAVGLAVVAGEVDVQVGDERTDAAGGAQALLHRGAEQRLVRDVEADHGHVEAAREHGRRSLGVAPDVELGRRREVSLRDRASHQNDPHDAVRSVCGEIPRNIRQRPGRDDDDGLTRAHEPVRRRTPRRVAPEAPSRHPEAQDHRGRSRRARARPRRARARAAARRLPRPGRRCARPARGFGVRWPLSSRASGCRTSS